MEKNIKEILNRIRKINKKINKSNFSRKEEGDKKLLKKTIIMLEKILNYIEKKDADIKNKNQ